MSEQTPATPKNKSGLAIATGVILVLAIVAITKFAGKQEEVVTTTDTTSPAPNQETITPSATTYKDGTYTAMGSYTSPGGAETIKITLTLQNGIVTDATAEPQAKGGSSKAFQGIFAQNFKTQVVGVSINTLNLTKVSGSSLTPKGFNEAVEQIKTQAKISA